MKVAELITKLQNCNPESDVRIWASEVPFDCVTHPNFTLDDASDQGSNLVFITPEVELLAYDEDTDWTDFAEAQAEAKSA